ncbi:MAG TPA: hypothetical protein VMV41_13695 [Cellulomonadaceae bacterium]|nr:hypothetical protein [Cellulomonadaceae bacterium]
MFVLTIDQQGSRTRGDRVPDLLVALAAHPALRRSGAVRPFERTVGDEVQAVSDSSATTLALALDVLRWGGWSVGIGAGPVDLPLPESTRAGAGPAFVFAREAVEAAKSRHRAVPVAVRGADPERAQEAESLVVLLAALRSRRTEAGWVAVDAIRAEGTPARQEQLAARLGISQQAVSQRLRTALWSEEQAALPLAVRLLDQADTMRHDGPGHATT